jgi:hypothetical protein
MSGTLTQLISTGAADMYTTAEVPHQCNTCSSSVISQSTNVPDLVYVCEPQTKQCHKQSHIFMTSATHHLITFPDLESCQQYCSEK